MGDPPAPEAVNGERAIEGFYDALLDDDAEALYERAPCGYLSTTPDGTIVKVNETFLTWTGYRRDELVGRRTFAQLLTAGGRIYHETHYAPMLRMQGRVREIALEVIAAGGARQPALVNSVLERDADGNPVVIRTAIFDAAERRAYERELVLAKERAETSEARATALARTLQQTLIPPAPPAVPGLDVAAVYRPAGAGNEVGGDFYDVFEVGTDDWVVVVGDVCGKGVEAAVVTAVARYTVRAAAVRHADPRDVLEIVNDVLLHHGTERFCTIALIRLRRGPEGWIATIGLGGHPLPQLLDADGGIRSVGREGFLVGVLESPEFLDEESLLRSGDILVIYTDGVTEGRDDRELFGEERLRDAIQRSEPTAHGVSAHVLSAVLEFQANDPRDDIVILAVRVP